MQRCGFAVAGSMDVYAWLFQQVLCRLCSATASKGQVQGCQSWLLTMIALVVKGCPFDTLVLVADSC
jgi:hypothetical protein